PDVVMLGDGGGIRPALAEPIYGAHAVSDFLGRGVGRLAGRAEFEIVQINGSPALLIHAEGEVSVVAMHVRDGLIAGLYVVRNPEKLSRVEQETPMSR
ncbi:MAG: RNA polymerase subunit sigma-24, partial [Catenulispora sp.]|nr:RNA polymerase subunit sigma-24 [Catenulispora sp.]